MSEPSADVEWQLKDTPEAYQERVAEAADALVDEPSNMAASVQVFVDSKHLLSNVNFALDTSAETRLPGAFQPQLLCAAALIEGMADGWEMSEREVMRELLSVLQATQDVRNATYTHSTKRHYDPAGEEDGDSDEH
jgi:hypothetical protein